MTFKKPTGTVDFYPEDKRSRKNIFDSLRNTAKKFGFNEVETPAIESLDLLTKKSGEEITSQLFTLEKKGNEKFALRFDLTVPFTRLFIEKQKELIKPVKWFGLSRMWRYERPQAGRLREFYQLSVEMFGSSRAEADAEIINLAVECLKDLGLSQKDFYVRLNNRKLLQGILEEFAPKKNIDKLVVLVDKKDKVSDAEFVKGLKDFKVKDVKGLKKILETNDVSKIKAPNSLAEEGLEELKNVLRLLDKKYVKVDLTTARGLAYYTGTVFELFDKSGKYRALAGGGRYDNLVKLFGGEDCPATGFAIGYATLSLLLKDKGLFKPEEEGVDYYIAPVNNKVKKQALDIASNLRKKFKVGVDLMSRKLGKQFAYADSIKASKVVIVGEKDLKEKKVTVRDMSSGKEKKVKLSDL